MSSRIRTSFAMIPGWVITRVTDATALRVYAHLAWRYADAERHAFPDEARLATELDIGERTVRRAVRQLNAAGALSITRTRQTGGYYGRNLYTLPIEEDAGRCTELRREEGDERVYLIGSPASTVVKIGRSFNVARRLRAIQPMSPLSLAVLWTTPGGEALETRLHRAFAAQRQHGEWFDFQQDDPLREITQFLGGDTDA